MADAAHESETVNAPIETLSCEVRWIRSGPLAAEVVDWFSRFSPALETREDDYLIAPRMPGLSVKVRGGATFDIKQHRGAAGSLDVAGGSGRIDSWLKLSFPLPNLADVSHLGDESAWRRVRKRRQIGVFPAGAARGSAASPEVCTVELTEAQALGRAWWTLAFESSGGQPLAGIRRAAAIVLAEQLPAQPAFRADEARSYAEWIVELVAERA